MNRDAIKRNAMLFLLAASVFPLFSACAAPVSDIISCDAASPYFHVLTDALPEYEISPGSIGYPAERFRESVAAELFDFQVEGMLQSNPTYYWYPHYAATVVIAVDRSLTQAPISGWNSLRVAGEPIMFVAEGGAFFRHCFAAVSYGLDGNAFSLNNALLLFEALAQQGLLTEDSAAPIQICFDYQAAAQIQAGRALEVIVPAEGTLSFMRGMLSRRELPLAGDMEAALIKQGFRFADGRCSSGLYPADASYQRAHTLEDYGQLNRATEEVAARYRREVLHERLYTTTDGREHILAAMATIITVIVWAGFTISRALGKTVRRTVLIAALLMILWILLRAIKWQFPEANTLNRYCWYCYYIFQLGLPVVLLRITLALGTSGDAPSPIWWKTCFLVNFAFLLLVLTNDFHMLVFRLDPSAPDWSSNYGYGIGYVLLLGTNICCVLAAIVLLLLKCRKNPRKYGLLFPIGFCAALVAYGLLYVFRIPFAWKGDFTLTAIILALLFLESSMQTGLIPMNSNYPALFTHSALSMSIVSPTGAPMLSSAPVAALPVLEHTPDYSLPFRMLIGPNLQLSGMPITGGAVVWQEDLSKLHALQNGLKCVVESLEQSNRLLLHEHTLREQAEALRARQHIYDDLETAIRRELTRAAAILQKLRGKSLDDASATMLCLLLCYCKRRSNLLFQQKQAAAFSMRELAAYLDELGQCVEHSGLTVAVRAIPSADLPPDAAARFYEFLFQGICHGLEHKWAVLICNISVLPENRLVMRLLSEEPFDAFAERFASPWDMRFSHDGFLYEASLALGREELHHV
mgnify:FL=1